MSAADRTRFSGLDLPKRARSFIIPLVKARLTGIFDVSMSAAFIVLNLSDHPNVCLATMLKGSSGTE